MAAKWESINVGDALPSYVHEKVTRTDLVKYAGASGDYNPLHTDDLYTKEVAGYPGVFAHGMLTMGITGKLLTDWVGDGRLKSYGVRFVNQVWPGDTLTATAEVTGLREHDGEHIVELSVTTVNQHDVPVVTGTATARVDA